MSVDRPIIKGIESLSQAKKSDSAIRDNYKKASIIPIESVDVAPVKIKSVIPRYEWRRFYKGSIKFILEALISEEGNIEEARIIGGAEAYEPVRKVVLEAIKQWKFRPAEKDGIKVKVWKEITIRINID